MDKLYLFVGEFEESYTGGSIVFISTEKFLNELVVEGMSVVTDRRANELRRLSFFFPLGYNTDGITPEKFWELVSLENFSEKFLRDIRAALTGEGNDFPGFGNGNIRVDWLVHALGSVPGGIYIVFKMEVDEECEDVKIISNTYYCA